MRTVTPILSRHTDSVHEYPHTRFPENPSSGPVSPTLDMALPSPEERCGAMLVG
jgi:hypothetical protein